MPTNTIDWNRVWKQKMRANYQCRGVRCDEIWPDRASARRYLAASGKRSDGHVAQTLAALPIEAASRVLDIGAGPGVLAVPAARRGAHVTAVEPSPGMMAVLKEYMAEEGVENITCVHKRWDEVSVADDLGAPYDVVVASMSLGMADIREAVRKMERAASRYVFLTWGAGRMGWETLPTALWPQLFNKPYCPGPKSDVLFNLLYQMDIYPNLAVFRSDNPPCFDSLEAAVADAARKYRLETPRQLAAVRDYLDRTLVRDNGALVLGGPSTFMLFWWEISKSQGA
jgi:SAM-dependent methyltransferase